MDPNERRYETVTARRFDLSNEEWAQEAAAINEADRRDGTLAFIDGVFEDAMSDEPDYEW